MLACKYIQCCRARCCNINIFLYKYFRPPPTFWEAAADAILLKKLRPFKHNPIEAEIENEHGSEAEDIEQPETFDDLAVPRFVNIPKLLENGNDIQSIKSYKSNDTVIDN